MTNKPQKVTLEQLEAMPNPEPMGRFHWPIRYSDIISAARRVINRVLMEEDDHSKLEEDLTLYRRGKLLIASWVVNGPRAQLTLPGELKNKTLLVGMFSHSQITNARLNVGTKIMACENLMLSGGDVVLRKKFTKYNYIVDNLVEGVHSWIEAKTNMETKARALSAMPLSLNEGARQILEVATKGEKTWPRGLQTEGAIVPWKYAEEAWQHWQEMEGEDLQTGRNVWSLLNCWTRALRNAPTQSKIQNTQAIHAHYGI